MAKNSKSSKGKKANKTKSGSWFGSFVRGTFKWCFVLGIWAVLIGGIIIAWYAQELPDVTEAMIFERRPTIIVQDAGGIVLDRYGDLKGESVAVEDLPPHLIYAVLAIEDRRFYSHFGIDVMGIARAFVVNAQEMRFAQGGSTITQQLAKNLFLSRDRTLKRKIQEAMLAIWLEQTLTKDEILSAYLNRVYMGAGAYGVDAASRVYFNKPATQLTLRQSASLAGLLKAPSRYSPSSNPDLAAERTATVLNSMVEAGFIEQAELNTVKQLPPSPRRKPSSGDTVRYFTDYVVSQIGELIGPVEEDLVVTTTLDRDIQKKAEQTITKDLLKYGSDRNISQGAAVVMRLDGAIVALVGGRDYGQSEFNRATHSYRSPGSAFKPFVYLAALEKGWLPDSIINDEPFTTGSYRPKNFGDQYYGPVTLQNALMKSLNTVAVRLAKEVGPGEVINTARQLGITADLEPDLSLSLGSSGVPLTQITAAYAALGRGGEAVEPFAITKIASVDGTIYYERPTNAQPRQVVSRKAVNNLAYMMRSVVESGTGQSASIGSPVAGKTGTSQDYKDAWFIGFTDKYAASVWYGNDDNTSMKNVTGGSLPATSWRDIMITAQAKPVQIANLQASVHAQPTFGGFQNMLDRLFSMDFAPSPLQIEPASTNIEKPNPQSEYTSRGRHQWDLNN